MTATTPDPSIPVPRETAEMAADATKADSTDRQSRSLVRDMPVGPMIPANGKTTR
jgi:hypothetical protein